MNGTLVCDLDGVVYLGETAIPGSVEALRYAEEAGWVVLFATNNSAGRPVDVVEKLERVSGYRPGEDQIVTSALVAASLVERGPVMVMGEEGVAAAVRAAGFDITSDPGEAATVVAGLDRGLTYQRVTMAADAIRGGARLVVTNRDPTFPSDVGLLPGAGACIAPIELAAEVTGVTAGKPTASMRRFIEERAGEGPIWMVGDRPETDLALAEAPRWKSILVLTGVTSDPGKADPVPDRVAQNLAEAVDSLLTSAGSDLVEGTPG